MKPFNEPLINEMSAFIKEYQLNKGVSPSYSVISTHFRISKSVVARYLKQLEMRGMLRKNDDGVIAIDTKLFKGNTKPTSLVGAVACGTPMFAEENIEGTFQLPVEIFGNSENFILRAKGYSMIGKGIYDGDLIIARKQNCAEKGETVIALIDDEATAKIYMPQKDKIILRAANDSVDENGKKTYPDIITKNCVILGVVHKVIHNI